NGACGEGPNGKKQVYDWLGYYNVVRELQPEAVIAVMGPDVRWVGTESGYGRETEWSVIPVSEEYVNKQLHHPEVSLQNRIFEPLGDLMATDLGSREKKQHAGGLIWYPSEVDVSIRPGWFYHESEDSLVKSPEKLFDIYVSSVGRNSVLLLNLPPDKRGLIHENDVKSLQGMRKILDSTFVTNLAGNSIVRGYPENTTSDPWNVLDNDNKSFWTTGKGVTQGILEFELSTDEPFDCVMLQENFLNGQRVEDFVLEKWSGDYWSEITSGSTIGYKRLMKFELTKAEKVRLKIRAARGNPQISSFGLYRIAGYHQ
ncbi:MAG: alpha-L-fucosidase, partial [Bacteroidetes bacterium]|nr:alpha-L-fucosidase [Bacteroidota bacterium]